MGGAGAASAADSTDADAVVGGAGINVATAINSASRAIVDKATPRRSASLTRTPYTSNVLRPSVASLLANPARAAEIPVNQSGA